MLPLRPKSWSRVLSSSFLEVLVLKLRVLVLKFKTKVMHTVLILSFGQIFLWNNISFVGQLKPLAAPSNSEMVELEAFVDLRRNDPHDCDSL